MSKGKNDLIVKKAVEYALNAWSQVALAMGTPLTARRVTSTLVAENIKQVEHHGITERFTVLERCVEFTSYGRVVKVMLFGYVFPEETRWRADTVIVTDGNRLKSFRYQSPWKHDPCVSGYPKAGDLWDDGNGCWALRDKLVA